MNTVNVQLTTKNIAEKSAMKIVTVKDTHIVMRLKDVTSTKLLLVQINVNTVNTKAELWVTSKNTFKMKKRTKNLDVTLKTQARYYIYFNVFSR